MINRYWNSNGLINFLVLPLSFIYLLLIKIYQIIKNEKSCNIPVICVGNLIMGGAGKTPTVIKIRKMLADKFTEIFVLTRGYKGKEKGPLLVKNNLSFLSVGEESLLHSKRGTTCVSKNKFAGAKYCESKGCNLLIMDDGLQSIDIKKNCRVLVIDANYSFGNKKIFPAGPLRETINEGLRKSDIILIIGSKNILENMKKISKEKVFLARKVIKYKKILNKNLFVFSAIGNNDNFHHSLKNDGFKIKRFIKFPDHHVFKNADLSGIIEEAKKYNLSIVCTEKDYIKVPSFFKKFINPIGLDLEIDKERLFKRKILAILKS